MDDNCFCVHFMRGSSFCVVCIYYNTTNVICNNNENFQQRKFHEWLLPKRRNESPERRMSEKKRRWVDMKHNREVGEILRIILIDTVRVI